MTRSISVLITAVAVALLFTAAAEASCIQMTPAEQRARAKVVFDGVALQGPTPSGVQRFRVAR